MPIIAGKLRKNAETISSPSESMEQQNLFKWAAFSEGKYPELKLLFHIPNGGSRTKTEGRRFKAEGVKPGVPDICLPVARKGYHGVYIEMKKQGDKVSKNQSEWLSNLTKQGYLTALCYTWESAAEILKKYLGDNMNGKKTETMQILWENE